MVDTRAVEAEWTVRRRRECDRCHFRFSTSEEPELLDIIVVKRDGRREGYLREKVEQGIRRSLTKRPFSHEKLHRLLQLIERDIQKKKTREVKSAEVGELVMKHLHTFDKVGYIRFASVYRDFKDVKTFERELKKLKR